ncbi:unnamed protein product, partial [Ranitomeya imitator]
MSICFAGSSGTQRVYLRAVSSHHLFNGTLHGKIDIRNNIKYKDLEKNKSPTGTGEKMTLPASPHSLQVMGDDTLGKPLLKPKQQEQVLAYLAESASSSFASSFETGKYKSSASLVDVHGQGQVASLSSSAKTTTEKDAAGDTTGYSMELFTHTVPGLESETVNMPCPLQVESDMECTDAQPQPDYYAGPLTQTTTLPSQGTDPESDTDENMLPRHERSTTNLHGDTDEVAHELEEEVIDDPVVDPDWQPLGEQGEVGSSSEAEEEGPQQASTSQQVPSAGRVDGTKCVAKPKPVGGQRGHPVKAQSAMPEKGSDARKSAVWHFFKQHPIDQRKVICQKCSTTLSRGQNLKSLYTSCMHRHLTTVHLQAWTNYQTSLKVVAPSANEASQQRYIPAITGLNAHIARQILLEMMPYRLVESEAFKALMDYAEPRYELPSRHFFLRKAIPALHQHVKERIVHALRQSVSTKVHLTTDAWTVGMARDVTCPSRHTGGAALNNFQGYQNALLHFSGTAAHCDIEITDSLQQATLFWHFILRSLSKIVAPTCLVLWERQKEIVLAPPKQEDCLAIAADFQKNAQSPHCIGAMDGKHIRHEVNQDHLLSLEIPTDKTINTSDQQVNFGCPATAAFAIQEVSADYFVSSQETVSWQQAAISSNDY